MVYTQSRGRARLILGETIYKAGACGTCHLPESCDAQHNQNIDDRSLATPLLRFFCAAIKRWNSIFESTRALREVMLPPGTSPPIKL